MNHDWVLWILLTASAIHVVEEHGLGWQGWAARTLGPRLGMAPSWLDFWATNGLLIVFGVSASAVGWRAPAFALAFAALALVNAIFFHVVPSIREKRPNPGLFTATLLYLPIGIWTYVAASDDGVLNAPTVVGSVLIGAISMAAVLVLLVLQRYFRYPDVDPATVADVNLGEGPPDALRRGSGGAAAAPDA